MNEKQLKYWTNRLVIKHINIFKKLGSDFYQFTYYRSCPVLVMSEGLNDGNYFSLFSRNECVRDIFDSSERNVIIEDFEDIRFDGDDLMFAITIMVPLPTFHEVAEAVSSKG